MCTNVLEEKLLNVFDLIDSSEGLTFQTLVNKLNDLEQKCPFNSFFSLDDILETNILIGRLEAKNDIIHITEKGRMFLDKLK